MKWEISPHMQGFLDRLSAYCATLPESEYYLMHDHPSFRAGKKAFAIVGDDTLSVKVPLMDQPLFLEDPRFTRTHYIGQHGWVTLDVSGAIDWHEVEQLVALSYRQAANKRMLKALDAREPQRVV